MKFDWHRLVFGPWLQNSKTDWQWDELLNKALDQHGVERSGSYLVKVGKIKVWVSNWPYAYGSPYFPFERHYLPSVKTRRRLRDMIHAQDMREIEGETK